MKKLLSVLLLLAGGAVALAADWYHWRGPFQTGVSPETNLPEKFSLDPKDPDSNLVWRAPFGCRSTPLVMNGRVFLINNVGKAITEQERVLCLDADTGKLLWEYKFNVWHTDIVSARLGWTNLAGDPKTGNVYAHGTQGLLICFNRDGKILWERSLTEEFGRISGYGGRICTPTVVDDLVIIGMLNSSWGDQGKGGNRFLAFKKDTGQVVWSSEPGGQPKDTYYSVPVVAVINGQKLIITGGADGGVYAMKVATGEVVWTYQLGTAMVNCSPVVQGTYVYIGHGEENFDNNILGRAVCLDAAAVEGGHPKEVWKVDGIKARYASPIVHGEYVYFPDDIGKLHCRDAKTGKKVWTFTYGTNARGSPVLADGKIYVGEVNSRFHILKPGPKKCERLFELEFFSADGKSDVEINGTPAIANGRVYFTTSEDTYCIGRKDAKSAVLKGDEPAVKATGKASHVQIFPSDVTIHPGETVTLTARLYDDHGNPMNVNGPVQWSLPTPPLPPGAKSPPPALKGQIAGTGVSAKVTVDAKMPSQQGYVVAKIGTLTGKARVRVAPVLPYAQDFEKVPAGAVPGGWVNTQGKFVVKELKGDGKVLAKVTDKPSPLVARGIAFIGEPHNKDYTIEADVQGGKVGADLPDMGVVANRYVLNLAGNIQKLRIVSWDALPRVDRTVPFEWKPGVWYRMKLTIETKNGQGIVKGKCWPRDQKEPAEWTVEVTDPLPNTEGAPGLYGYVLGIPEGGSGTDIFYDNVRIMPNKK